MPHLRIGQTILKPVGTNASISYVAQKNSWYRNDTNMFWCSYKEYRRKSDAKRFSSVILETDLFGVKAEVGRNSAAKQKADDVVSNLSEPEIVVRGFGQRHGEADSEKEAGEEIHR